MASLIALMEQMMTLLVNFNQIPLQLVSVVALTIKTYVKTKTLHVVKPKKVHVQEMPPTLKLKICV